MIDDPPISDLQELSSVGEATFVRVVFGVFPLLRMFLIAIHACQSGEQEESR
jgi:hypothetical protein